VIPVKELRRVTELKQLRHAIIQGYSAPEFNDGPVKHLIDVARSQLVTTA